jgi:hypothetical protein
MISCDVLDLLRYLLVAVSSAVWFMTIVSHPDVRSQTGRADAIDLSKDGLSAEDFLNSNRLRTKSAWRR